MALLADLTNQANWQRGGGKGQRPALFPRPGDAPSPREARASTNRMRRMASRFLARQRKRAKESDPDA